MNRLLAKLTLAASLVSCGGPAAAQLLPPAKKAAHVEIIKGPELEFARDDLAIIRWNSTNPGGGHDHFAVVHYGTDPKELTRTAKAQPHPHRDDFSSAGRRSDAADDVLLHGNLNRPQLIDAGPLRAAWLWLKQTT